MLTETAVNTIPFLDNLFWSKNATKSMPNLSDDQVQLEDNNKCTIELLVFEKHSKECRSVWLILKTNTYLHFCLFFLVIEVTSGSLTMKSPSTMEIRFLKASEDYLFRRALMKLIRTTLRITFVPATTKLMLKSA